MTSKRLVAMVMSYDWRCIECKPCEICKEKGDDVSSRERKEGREGELELTTESSFDALQEKILFCDKCDRGTHYDCLDPVSSILLKAFFRTNRC